MKYFRKFILFVVVVSIFTNFSIGKEVNFVFINAKCGINSIYHDNVEAMLKIFKSLIQKNNISENQIFFFNEKQDDNFVKNQRLAEKDLIINFLKEKSKSLKNDDKLIIFLSGYASTNSKGYSLATLKGRLRGTDLRDCLKQIAAEKIIFSFTTAGGSLLNNLKELPKTTILSATNSNENSPPRLMTFYATQKSNTAKLIEPFYKAVKDVKNFYTSQQLLLLEKAAVMKDGEIKDNNNITLSEPLVNKQSTNSKQKNNFNESKFNKLKRFHDIKNANAETRKLLQQAHEAKTKYEKDYHAFAVTKTEEFIVNKDKSMRQIIKSLYFITSDIGAQQFVYIKIPHNSKVKQLRLIYPDGSYMAGNSFNSRGVKFVKFFAPQKGCLVQIEYSKDIPPNNQIYESFGNIIVNDFVPVQKMTVKILKPQNKYFNVRVSKNENTKVNFKILENNDQNFTAVFSDVYPIEISPYTVSTTPLNIEIQFSTLKNWSKLVEMMGRLLKSTRKISPNDKRFIEELTATAKTDTEKIKAIYNFLCDLRYETVAVNSKALKPQNVSSVITNRFGDCKDKANALITMANAIGIKGYFALVNRGKFTDKSFPSWQFNHAIAFFPKLSGFEKGFWCDATDGSTPFGVMPTGDIGRDALIFDDKNSYFKKIEANKCIENFIEQKITLTKTKKSNYYNGEIILTFSGNTDYKIRSVLKRLSPQKKFLFCENLLQQIVPFEELSKFNIISNLEDLNNNLIVSLNFKITQKDLENIKFFTNHELLNYFKQSKRIYNLAVNDAQPLTVKQLLVIKNPPKSYLKAKKFQYENNIIKISRDSEFKNDTFSQKIILKCKKGIIKSKDYSIAREAIKKFLRNYK
ncbi:transglutaminase domain-containing protein [Lentisphaerota bacterium WC36G]|nr:hypothetical protein LJT99_04710 [Lentisphaerae bacterium WC36]